MRLYHPRALRRRAKSLVFATGVVLAALILAFFRLQVLQSDDWVLRASSNRVRVLPIPAPRGTIYDRNGIIIADNVPGYSITVLPGPVDSVRATLIRMSEHVELSDRQIERALEQLRRFGREVVIDSDADFDMVSRIEERRAEFPGVYIDMRPRRRYNLGASGAHLTGYVGEITADELEMEMFPDSVYSPGGIVGKIGIERQYES